MWLWQTRVNPLTRVRIFVGVKSGVNCLEFCTRDSLTLRSRESTMIRLLAYLVLSKINGLVAFPHLERNSYIATYPEGMLNMYEKNPVVPIVTKGVYQMRTRRQFLYNEATCQLRKGELSKVVALQFRIQCTSNYVPKRCSRDRDRSVDTF